MAHIQRIGERPIPPERIVGHDGVTYLVPKTCTAMIANDIVALLAGATASLIVPNVAAATAAMLNQTAAVIENRVMARMNAKSRPRAVGMGRIRGAR